MEFNGVCTVHTGAHRRTRTHTPLQELLDKWAHFIHMNSHSHTAEKQKERFIMKKTCTYLCASPLMPAQPVCVLVCVFACKHVCQWLSGEWLATAFSCWARGEANLNEGMGGCFTEDAVCVFFCFSLIITALQKAASALSSHQWDQLLLVRRWNDS